MATDQPTVTCGQCETQLDAATDQSPDERTPCPVCGSLSRLVHVYAHDSVKVHESIGLVQKRPGFVGRSGRSKGGVVMRLFSGAEQSADGTWVHKVSLFDRLNDRRYERVTDEDGNLLHHQDHPLTEHRGHGSDKPRE
jgi:hypothetical protein